LVKDLFEVEENDCMPDNYMEIEDDIKNYSALKNYDHVFDMEPKIKYSENLARQKEIANFTPA